MQKYHPVSLDKCTYILEENQNESDRSEKWNDLRNFMYFGNLIAYYMYANDIRILMKVFQKRLNIIHK